MGVTVPWRMPPHLLTMSALQRIGIERLLDLAGTLENQGLDGAPQTLTGTVVGLLFSSPSVRTRSSFHSAALRLGGHVIDLLAAGDSRGSPEAITDIVQSVDLLCSCLVIRHAWSPSSGELSATCRIPVINGGLMFGEHPTQALADMYTLRQAFGTWASLHVGLVADTLASRELCSLLAAFDAFPEVRVTWFSNGRQPVLPMRVQEQPIETLADHARALSAIYVVPGSLGSNEWSATVASSIRTAVRVNQDLMLLHPLPRGPELPRDLDSHVRSAYFLQARNGLWVREAVLTALLGRG